MPYQSMLRFRIHKLRIFKMFCAKDTVLVQVYSELFPNKSALLPFLDPFSTSAIVDKASFYYLIIMCLVDHNPS